MKFHKESLIALVSNDEINLVRGGGQVKTARHQQPPVSAFLTRLLRAGAAPATVHCCGGQVTHPAAAVQHPPTVTAAPVLLSYAIHASVHIQPQPP